jgi:hypothetical protein
MLKDLTATRCGHVKGDSIQNADISRENLKAIILYKLSRHKRWGDTHTELIHVRSSLPKKYWQDAEELAKELANEGLITWLKKTGQIHISLRSSRKSDIAALLRKYYPTVPFAQLV